MAPTSTPGEHPASPSQPEQTQEPERHEIPEAQLKAIKKKMGHSAIIATEFSKEDRDSFVTEALSIKAEEYMREHPVLARFPIVSGVVKAAIAAKNKAEVINAIDQSGKFNDELFESLGLERSDFRTIGDGGANATERAQQLLESEGYSDDNQIGAASSRLGQGEKVEQMDAETQAAVKNALNEYYSGLKQGGDEEELSKAFDEAIAEAFAGKGNLDASVSLESQKSAIRELAETRSVSQKSVKNYINEHLTLYSTNMREGINTKQEVDSVMKAVIGGGLAAGVFMAVATYMGRSSASRIIGGGVVGGAVAGALRGWERAKIKASESEIKAATTFGPQMPTEPEEISDYSQKLQDQAEEEIEAQANEEATPKSKLGAKILSGIANLYSKATGEGKYLAEIEVKRDRKNASDLDKKLSELIDNYDPDDEESKTKLETAYAEIIARSRFSSDKQIDLIKYQGDDKSKLESKLVDAEQLLYKDDQRSVEEIEKDETSQLHALLQAQLAELNGNYTKAEAIRKKFMARQVAADAVVGALMGGAIGSVFSLASGGNLFAAITEQSGVELDASNHTPVDLEKLPGQEINLVEDEDGGFAVMLGEQTLIGEGDAPGIEYDTSGALTDESKEMLENAGIEVNEVVTPHTLEGARTNVSLQEFFSPENKDVNNLTEVTNRSWITDGYGNAQAIIGNAHMDGEGNIIIQVAPTQGSDLSLDGMKMLFTPDNGSSGMGITLDVNPDGTVEIPAGSPVAELFSGDEYQGGFAELIREGDNGHIDVYSTIGDGSPDVSEISVANPDATYNTYEYTFTVDGQTYEAPVPQDIAASAAMEARTGLESLKGTGEPIGYELNGEVTGLQTTTGEAVEIEHFEHHGGYSNAVDTYFGEKDGVYNSGESVVRSMLGNEADGLSAQEADRLFLDKVNSGEIAEGDIVEEYFKTMGNSPEAITTTRAMLGDFEMDLDGDGTMELIDTQDEINVASDIISRDPEAYDAFVNDTYDLFYEKIEGGTIRVIDYTQESYQYTTWGELGEDNNILQRLGTYNSPTNGVGIVFTDKAGNSIYDEDIVRRLWHLPDNYNLEYVADRLNCIQKTGTGVFTDSSVVGKFIDEGQKDTDEKQVGEKQTDEKQTGEKQTDEKQTGEKQTDEKQTNEKQIDEKQTDEKQTDEKQVDEKQTDEKQTDELTGKGPDANAGPGAQIMDETEYREGTNYVEATPDNHVDPNIEAGSEVSGGDSTVYSDNTVPGDNGEPLTDNSGNIYITDPGNSDVSAEEIMQNIDDGTTTYTEDTTDWVADAPSDVPSTTSSEPVADSTASNSSGSTASSASASTDNTNYDQDELASIFSNIEGGKNNE